MLKQRKSAKAPDLAVIEMRRALAERIKTFWQRRLENIRRRYPGYPSIIGRLRPLVFGLPTSRA